MAANKNTCKCEHANDSKDISIIKKNFGIKETVNDQSNNFEEILPYFLRKKENDDECECSDQCDDNGKDELPKLEKESKPENNEASSTPDDSADRENEKPSTNSTEIMDIVECDCMENHKKKIVKRQYDTYGRSLSN